MRDAPAAARVRRRDGRGFLAAEVGSAQYGAQIRQILAGLGPHLDLIQHPDTREEAANALRRRVLATYRGYPSGDMFTGMPADVTWHYAALTAAELATVRYGTTRTGPACLAVPGWPPTAPGSSALAVSAAATIHRRIAENLRYGKLPPTIIASVNPAWRT
jgi:hypothetical protein